MRVVGLTSCFGSRYRKICFLEKYPTFFRKFAIKKTSTIRQVPIDPEEPNDLQYTLTVDLAQAFEKSAPTLDLQSIASTGGNAKNTPPTCVNGVSVK